jgi:hypothetical protein
MQELSGCGSVLGFELGLIPPVTSSKSISDGFRGIFCAEQGSSPVPMSMNIFRKLNFLTKRIYLRSNPVLPAQARKGPS